jgi:chorismate--pyruvate lyase
MNDYWYPSRCIARNKISPSLRSWLFDPSSTTSRFRKISNNLVVKVLEQGWLMPTENERLFLKLLPRQLAFIREVEIYCDDIPCMTARTVIPRSSLIGKNRHLLFELDDRPLGELLFRDPTLKRSEFEFSLLKSGQKEYESIAKFFIQNNVKIWARRSQFFLSGKPLLLTEIFLPIEKSKNFW